MSLFTSDRERRLWLWTLAVMVAIYSTLGPARTLADALRERNLLEVSFALVLLLWWGPSPASWVKRRPGWREIGVALGVALAYLAMFLRMESPEERTHLIEYGIVAALIHQALLERVAQWPPVPVPAALTVAVTALLGLLDEGIQAMLPSRVFDVRDDFLQRPRRLHGDRGEVGDSATAAAGVARMVPVADGRCVRVGGGCVLGLVR